MNRKQRLQFLQSLYSKIPSFECIKGCRDCCGVVPFSSTEMDLVSDKRPMPSPGNPCPYECKEGCSIYEKRPLICRIYGTTDRGRLACPHGFMPVTVLSESQVNAIMAEYLSKLFVGVHWKDSRRVLEDKGIKRQL